MESTEAAGDERQAVDEEAISGRISDKGVAVEGGGLDWLEQAGYGERSGSKYTLKEFEALYLMFVGKLDLKDQKGRRVEFEELAARSQKKASDSWTKFIIYRDLRSRGYVVKDGFGFGTDLRAYERGDYPSKAAKYVVFALDEGTETTVDRLEDSIAQITKMGKEAIVAVIERRGEVIYYRVSRANFR